MDFRAAEGALGEALALVESPELAATRARALIALGTVRAHGGALELGEARVREAIALLAVRDAAPILGLAYRRLAEILNAQGRGAEADAALDAAATLFRRLGDPRRLASLDVVRSTLAVHRGDYPATKRAAWRALDVLSGGPALNALSNLAYAEHQLGELESAERRYGDVLRLAWRVGDQYAIDFAFCNRAEVRWRRGAAKPALADLERAVAGFEASRSKVAGGPEERAELFARQVAAFDRLVRYRANTGAHAAAFEAAERFHGRSVLDLLDPTARQLLQQSHPDLETAERVVLARLAKLHRPPSTVSRAGEHGQEITALEAELRRLDGLRWRRETVRATQVTTRPPTVEEIRAVLASDEVLVAYWLADDQLLAWVLSRDTLEQVRIPVERERLASWIDAYLEPLTQAAMAEDWALRGVEKEHLEVGRRLYDTLVRPLPALAHQAERWIVVPDTILHDLPLGALVRDCEPEAGREGAAETSGTIHEPYTGCRFLGLEKALIRVPSAGVLHTLRRRRETKHDRPRGELLALAPGFEGSEGSRGLRGWGPLEHSGEEIHRIARWFEGAHLLEGGSATEGHLLSEAGRYRRIHLATHGWVDDDHPLGSGLALAAAAGDDGLLQTAEILRLELDAELVTLSACRSGRGTLTRGEGIRGLAQAFLHAGSDALVVSLWDVDDPVMPLLMDAFYRSLAAGETPAVALRDARRQLFEIEGRYRLAFRERTICYAHPRFWAGFVVLGDG